MLKIVEIKDKNIEKLKQQTNNNKDGLAKLKQQINYDTKTINNQTMLTTKQEFNLINASNRGSSQKSPPLKSGYSIKSTQRAYIDTGLKHKENYPSKQELNRLEKKAFEILKDDDDFDF